MRKPKINPKVREFLRVHHHSITRVAVVADVVLIGLLGWEVIHGAHGSPLVTGAEAHALSWHVVEVIAGQVVHTIE